MRILLLILSLCLGALPALAHGDETHDDDDRSETQARDFALPDRITYHQHVRPIIESSCATCHSDGQIAEYAPFADPLEVASVADDIRYHVVNEIMPPWMPSRQNLPLEKDRSLSLEEIALIAAWADSGAPLGDPDSYAPAATPRVDFADIRADLTLMLDQPYTPEPNALDDYRCFAFPLDIDAPQFITGYELSPGVMAMAHHAILYLVDGDLEAEIQRRDGADGKPGWQCYGGSGLSRGGGDIIATWTPGTFGVAFPPGTGYRIEPGQIVLLQMHYNLWTTRQSDQTRIVLQIEGADSDLAELVTFTLTAPVEIPCPSGVEGAQCQRETAIQRIAELYGPELSRIPDRRLRFCLQTLDDYADNRGEHARGFCDFPSPYLQPVTILGVLGHMHELGRSFRLELNPDGAEPQLLLDIPRWDFHWQDRYQLVDPVEVNFGEVTRMTCVWDNRLSDDPRYVVWGEGTSDEMCFAAVMALRS